jgi:hypothetical protein
MPRKPKLHKHVITVLVNDTPVTVRPKRSRRGPAHTNRLPADFAASNEIFWEMPGHS